MLKILKWIGIGFIFLIVIGLIFGDKKEGVSDDVVDSASAPVEPYKTTARQLFSDYEDNEVATDIRIDKRPVEISGVVQGISKDFTDSVYINLSTSNQFMPARIGLVDGAESHAASLKRGQKVVFLCKKMMRLVGAPSGSDCAPL